MKLTHFFWFCAGANRKLLQECETDHSRYMGIGATVFFTAVFATISSGYAIYFVFSGSPHAMWIAVPFGVFWGLTIFNIDRYLVLSLRKDGNLAKEFWLAFPRILLALMIGVVIARPLELKIFDKEIKEVLKQYYLENETQLINTKNSDFDKKYKVKEDELTRRRQELTTADSDLTATNKLKEDELFGHKENHTTGIVGDGPRYKERLQEAAAKDEKKQTIAKQVTELETFIGTKRSESGLDKVSKLDDATLDSIAGTAGFLDRNKMLGQISSWTPFSLFKSETLITAPAPLVKEKGPQVKESASKKGDTIQTQVLVEPVRVTEQRFNGKEDKTVFFISMLFICIECLPIIVKLMSSKSTYDVKLQEEDERMRYLIRHETYANKHLVSQMAIAQREVLTRAIEQWEENELDSNDLGNRYINVDNE